MDIMDLIAHRASMHQVCFHVMSMVWIGAIPLLAVALYPRLWTWLESIISKTWADITRFCTHVIATLGMTIGFMALIFGIISGGSTSDDRRVRDLAMADPDLIQSAWSTATMQAHAVGSPVMVRMTIPDRRVDGIDIPGFQYAISISWDDAVSITRSASTATDGRGPTIAVASRRN
jgi:hypothetical protein